MLSCRLAHITGEECRDKFKEPGRRYADSLARKAIRTGILNRPQAPTKALLPSPHLYNSHKVKGELHWSISEDIFPVSQTP